MLLKVRVVFLRLYNDFLKTELDLNQSLTGINFELDQGSTRTKVFKPRKEISCEVNSKKMSYLNNGRVWQ